MPISGVLTTAGHQALAKGLVGAISGVSLTNIISYFVYGEGGFQVGSSVAESIGTGDGFTTSFPLMAMDFKPVQRGTLTVTVGAVTATDNGNGLMTGAGVTGTVHYKNGTVSLTYVVPPVGAINATYQYRGNTDVADTALTTTRAQLTPVDPTNPAHLAWVKKNFVLSGPALKEYIAIPAPKFKGTMFLDLAEFLDDGRGESPYVYEVGAFDAEDQMIAYATFDRIVKTGSVQISKKVNIIT